MKAPNSGIRVLPLALYTLAVCALDCSPLALGATVNMSIVNFAFTPSSVNISVNDSVKWTWAGSPHSTTSDASLWESGVLGTGATFTHMFTSAGNFPFHCSVHPFMTGTVGVQSANMPPTVGINNPTNSSIFAAPATFTFTATASDTDGSVTNVQFFQGATSLGNAAKSPYSVAVNNLAAGNYTFSAVATDNSGSKATNAIRIQVVSSAPIILSVVQQLVPTGFRFNYSANTGLRYVVQRSVDLTTWTALSTNTANTDSEIFLDQNASGNPGFYRVGRVPNP